MSELNERHAVLRSAAAPTAEQKERFSAFLKRTYHQNISLSWEQDPTLREGFRLQVSSDLYDWSMEGRLRQLEERLEQLKTDG